MLRTTSHIKSLADLNDETQVTFTKGRSKKPKVESRLSTGEGDDDAMSPRNSELKTRSSEAVLPDLLKSFRCPVAHGKPKVSSTNARPFMQPTAQAEGIGHNGCALDPDDANSVGIYISATAQIMRAPYQNAPQHEVGRMLEVAKLCKLKSYHQAKMGGRFDPHDAKADQELTAGYARGVINADDMASAAAQGAADHFDTSKLILETARAMAKESVDARGKVYTPSQRTAQEHNETERMVPFAYKLVKDRSRRHQAQRRSDTWMQFHDDIRAFAHAYISKHYAAEVKAHGLRFDPELVNSNPTLAYESAVGDAYDKQWEKLAKDALRNNR